MGIVFVNLVRIVHEDRLAAVPLPVDLDPQFVHEPPNIGLRFVIADPLPADLEQRAVGERRRPRPAADAGCGLQHRHRVARSVKAVGGGQSGIPGAHDTEIGLALGHRCPPR